MKATPLLTGFHEAYRSTMQRLARESFADGYLRRSAQTTYPYDTLKELAATGLLGLGVPTEHGGEGADLVSIGIACEQLAYADQAVAFQLFAAVIQGRYLTAHASDLARATWLPRMLAGDAVGCLALSEPGAGSDAAAMSTLATRADHGWVLHGEKTSVTSAPHADVAILLAKTEPAAGSRGVTAFLVPLDDPTITRQAFRDPGFKSLGRGAITLDGTYVPDSFVLGEPGDGFRAVMATFDLTRILIGLLVVGAAQRGLDLTSDYVKQRETFGRPLSENQGVSFLVAEHTTHVHTVRILAYHALALADSGTCHTTEAAMIKWLGPEVAFQALKDCIVLHGHVGWSDEMPLQALLRDVSGYLIGDGTPQIQKLIIARDVLGRQAIGT